MRQLVWCSRLLAIAIAGCGGMNEASGPTVDSSSVTLVPGTDLYVAADQTNGALINLRRVDPPSAPQDVIHLSFVHEAASGSTVATLTVGNFFSQAFVYHASVNYAGSPSGSYVHTSTCPTFANGQDVELWPQPVNSLIVRDFLFSTSATCTYY